jgi:hypothetical protein
MKSHGYRNLHRGGGPGRGRGRLQRQLRRCFIVHGPDVSASVIYSWCTSKRASWPHRWSIVRILREIAVPIGRASTPGEPWIWRLRERDTDAT